MNREELFQALQTHLGDGLMLVVGSGLSAAEGLPGMPALAEHLREASCSLDGEDAALWRHIGETLAAGVGLEAALQATAPSESLAAWIAVKTAECLLPAERSVVAAVAGGERTLRLTELLRYVIAPPSGVPIVTSNYDRLIEVACEAAGFHVDTTATGVYMAAFDHKRSCMASCRSVRHVGKHIVLEHYPRAIVLKPHGSLDWYRSGESATRCSIDIGAPRLMITPGLSKYRAGYESPFDTHRDLANQHIDKAARFLVIGYGFNDAHLQTHLVKRIRDGAPALIMTRTATEMMLSLAGDSRNCLVLSALEQGPGFHAVGMNCDIREVGVDLWDIGVMAKEIL